MLQQLSIYLLKVTCISGLLFLYYHIALRNKQFHFYNRFYILITVVISAVLPFLQLQWFTLFSSSAQTIHLFNILNGKSEDEVIVSNNPGFSMQQITLYVLAAASFIMLLVSIMRIIKIYKLKRKYAVQRSAAFDFINTDIASAPFSFLRNIFWRKDISLQEETGKQILQHEITHVQQKHSWDKLFMQFVLCFYWLNPFYHLLKNELYLIHEFIADEKAVKHSDADAFAKMLLTTQFGRFNFLPAQPIFYSSIKRRLIMLTTSKKPQFNYLRRIMALPLTAVLVCLFAFSVKKNDTLSSQKKMTAKPFVLVVDAGHGGKDYGALGNGLYEKNVALKIAEKINELSSQYGITVILTRNSDVFMSPPDKSDFANAQNADALISIHVNADNKNQLQQSGFEVLLSADKENLLNENHVLASAILQNISKDFKAATALHQMKQGIWILKNSNIPAALVECGYLTNSNDAVILKDDAKIELIAKTILQGVVMYANNTFDKSNLYQLQNTDTTAPGTSKTVSSTPLYIVNGKIISKQEADKIDANTIEKVDVLKDKNATDKYGEQGKTGVVEITLKSASVKFKPPIIVRDSDGMVNPSNSIGDKPVFTEAQIQPQFPGGADGWQKYLMQNLDASIPAKNKAPNGICTVTISFLIDENGKVSDVKAINDPGFGTGKEAVRVIAQGPDWIPATQNGYKVVFANKQKIAFSVSE